VCLQCGIVIENKKRYCKKCKCIIHNFNVRRDGWGKFMPFEVYKESTIIAAGKTFEDITNDPVVKELKTKGEKLVWCNVITNQGGFIGKVNF